MSRPRLLWLVIVVLVTAAERSPIAEADTPWDDLLTFKRVEADPEKSYRLTKENGPWVIIACSFTGDAAERQAKDLALELRAQYKLEAYTHRMHFDFVNETDRRINQSGQIVPLRYNRGEQRDAVAVLVGNYAAFDDPRAQKTLTKLKYSHPKCMELDINDPTTRDLAQWRILLKEGNKQRRGMGPMIKAFITANPLLPKGSFVPSGLEPFVVRMNKSVKHSLLACPSPYTVMVAKFDGMVAITQLNKDKLHNSGGGTNRLADAAMKAHRLTEALRLKGWEAYEFHDRYCSMVTVGSFDSVGTPRADGRIEMHPKMYRVIETFKAEPYSGPTPAGVLPQNVKTLLGIQFLMQPIPVEVPKRSFGREMAGMSR